ncbi:DciA family protein [Halomonas piscis]|uniref:DciA family protein n=1 Tax=Halomonas piscis TaxID=3031727 RepID=A0ABY9Z2R9_9GAMM|nr:DciA family protein [Halomonas piscis]WNK21436.1 DciA family protein [Halomonas piscis]
MSIKVKRSRAQPVGQLLKPRGDIGRLMQASRLIDEAQRRLRADLPEPMREHVFVGGVSEGRLTLICDRAALVTWLRFEQPRLLTLLHGIPGFEGVTGLRFKVRPVRPVKAPRRYCRTLPQSAGKVLTECAEETRDPGLKAALERLASHAPR